MMDFWRKLNENPVYLREKLLFGREQARKKFVSPIGLHLVFLILPTLSGCFYRLFEREITMDNLKTVFALSIFFSIIFYLFTGFTGCSLFAREKERRTYNDLISTAMSPEEIVLGKFWFSFYPAAREMTLYLPIYLIMGFLLKMSLLPLFLIYVLVLIIIALTSLAGLYFSINSKTEKEASVRAAAIVFPVFFVLTMVCLFVPCLYLFDSLKVGFRGEFLLKAVMEILFIINPLSLFLDLFTWTASGSLNRTFAGMMELSNSPLIFPAAMLIYILAALSLYKKVVSKVAEIPEDSRAFPAKVKGGEAGTDGKTAPEDPDKSPGFMETLLSLPEIILFPRFIVSIFSNPVFFKDVVITGRQFLAQAPERKKNNRMSFLSKYSGWIPVILILFFISHKTDDIPHYLFLIIVLMILLNFIASSLASGELIKKEKIAGTWDNLISSLITPKDIFRGKFWCSFYPRVRWIIFQFPVFLIVGILCKVTIPGLILFFILTAAIGVLFTTAGLYEALYQGRKMSLSQKILSALIFPLLMATVPGSALIVEKVCQSYHLIPTLERQSFFLIYPIPDLWISASKGIFDGFSPVLLLSALGFLLLNLSVIVLLTTYFHKKSLEIIGEVEE